MAALGASPVGIGTDIGTASQAQSMNSLKLSQGGSVRIPAAFCGICSIKPTHNRFSYRDVANIVRQILLPNGVS